MAIQVVSVKEGDTVTYRDRNYRDTSSYKSRNSGVIREVNPIDEYFGGCWFRILAMVVVAILGLFAGLLDDK